MQNLLNILFTAKKGTLESLVQSKEMKISELRSQLDEQKVEMDHKTSHETSLGGQMAVLRDEKAKFGKDLLNANQTKKELENRLEEKNQLIEEMQAKMDSKQVNTYSFLNFFFQF